MQQADFEGIFEAMAGLPVTVRLLDPPLHEFLPRAEAERDLERPTRTTPSGARAARASAPPETNPMLGTRGVRLGLLHPEIYEMQARAIVRAGRAVGERTGDGARSST